jgi:hypothetical protein
VSGVRDAAPRRSASRRRGTAPGRRLGSRYLLLRSGPSTRRFSRRTRQSSPACRVCHGAVRTRHTPTNEATNSDLEARSPPPRSRTPTTSIPVSTATSQHLRDRVAHAWTAGSAELQDPRFSARVEPLRPRHEAHSTSAHSGCVTAVVRPYGPICALRITVRLPVEPLRSTALVHSRLRVNRRRRIGNGKVHSLVLVVWSNTAHARSMPLPHRSRRD